MVNRTTTNSLLVVVMMAMIIRASAGGRKFSDLREAEVRKHLKRLNKPAVKSIHSPDGDIIDCIRITDQHAFDHHLLKNHTIQMKPSFHPEGHFTERNKKKQKAIIQLWHMNGECPKNTVPVRRTRREDLLRPTSIESFGRKSRRQLQETTASDPIQGHEHAITYVYGNFYGTKAFVNVWKPYVRTANEFSLGQTWLVAGNGSQTNTVEAGWQVYPYLYGDYNPRFFVYWTRDGYRNTGCYNLLCSGFVQIDNSLAIGASISPVSKYRHAQYELSILIWKDRKQGVWWLQLRDTVVGYWPGSLFTHLSDSSTLVEWGGEVYNLQPNGKHTTTDMGSGHFADEGSNRASYFRNLLVVDESNTLRDPPLLQTFAQRRSCYNVQIGSGDTTWRSYFYYGGPGQNPRCQ